MNKVESFCKLLLLLVGGMALLRESVKDSSGYPFAPFSGQKIGADSLTTSEASWARHQLLKNE